LLDGSGTIINGKSSASPKKMEESKTKDSDESETMMPNLNSLVALCYSPVEHEIYFHDNECVQDLIENRLSQMFHSGYIRTVKVF
jgi:hypothetical protein